MSNKIVPAIADPMSIDRRRIMLGLVAAPVASVPVAAMAAESLSLEDQFDAHMSAACKILDQMAPETGSRWLINGFGQIGKTPSWSVHQFNLYTPDPSRPHFQAETKTVLFTGPVRGAPTW